MSNGETQKSISEDEVSDCISEKIDEGWNRERAVAACLNMAEEGSSEPEKNVSGLDYLSFYFDASREEISKNVEEVDTVPTQEMADIASEVLEKIDDSDLDNDDCGTRTGLERANQLENREELSADTVGRMASFFARHDGNQEINEDVDNKWEDCGYVAWQLWGGDPGRDWAERKMDEIEEAREDEDKTNTMGTENLEQVKNNDSSKNRENIKRKSFTVKGEDVEVVKNETDGAPVVNVPIQALSEDRDGDFINEKGQESIIRQLKSGQVPLVPNHGVGMGEAMYDFTDIFGQFVDGDNRNGTTIGTARLREGSKMAEELVDLLEQDMPVGFSVGFIPTEKEPREKGEGDGMEISDLDLMEVSAVGIPSNPDAVPQAMGQAVAMAKNAGLQQSQIKSAIEKAFKDVKDTMTEKQEQTNTDQKQEEDSKSTEVKQMDSEDVELVMETIQASINEHLGMAMDEAEDEIMAMLDEEENEDEETDEMDEEEDDDMEEDGDYGDSEDEDEERSTDPEKQEQEDDEKQASDHSEESEKDSTESADTESEEKDLDEVPNTAEKNNSSEGKELKTIDNKDSKDGEESSEKSEEKELSDPFAVREV